MIVGIQTYMHTAVIACLQVLLRGCHIGWELIELQYKTTSITGDALYKTFTGEIERNDSYETP